MAIKHGRRRLAIASLLWLAVATLCPQAAWGQWDFEARLAPHVPSHSEGHGEAYRNIGELWFRLPAHRGHRGEVGTFRTGEGNLATFGIEKELLHGRLLPGIFAWVDSKGVQPAFGVSWVQHGQGVLDGHLLVAKNGSILGRGDFGLTLSRKRGVSVGITAEIDPAHYGRAWGLGPHVKKSFKGAEVYFGHLWKKEGQVDDRHGHLLSPPPAREWLVGVKYSFGHPKAEGHKSSHH